MAEEPALLSPDEVKGMRKIGESINVKKKIEYNFMRSILFI